MTLNEIYKSAKQKQKFNICRFMKDMKKNGLKMREYHGRVYWHGPAVVCDSLQDVLSNTKIKCKWDNLGLRWIVYPIQSL